MTKQPLTRNTITVKQIKALRNDALEAGDYRQVDWCDIALAAHEHSDSEGNGLISPSGVQTTRSMARKICADVINAAAGEDDLGSKSMAHATKGVHARRIAQENADVSHGKKSPSQLKHEIAAILGTRRYS